MSDETELSVQDAPKDLEILVSEIHSTVGELRDQLTRIEQRFCCQPCVPCATRPPCRAPLRARPVLLVPRVPTVSIAARRLACPAPTARPRLACPAPTGHRRPARPARRRLARPAAPVRTTPLRTRSGGQAFCCQPPTYALCCPCIVVLCVQCAPGDQGASGPVCFCALCQPQTRRALRLRTRRLLRALPSPAADRRGLRLPAARALRALLSPAPHRRALRLRTGGLLRPGAGPGPAANRRALRLRTGDLLRPATNHGAVRLRTR